MLLTGDRIFKSGNRVYRIYQEIVPFKLKVYDGVIELLTGLQRQRIKTALASSADLVKITANLSVAKILRALFAAIISGEDVTYKKPDPEIYLLAAQKLEMPPVNCVVVEDALNGIQAAKAARMKCIAVATSFTKEFLQKGNPDFICSQIFEVGPIVNQLT